MQIEKYDSLIEECKAIIVESEFASRDTLIRGYHLLGRRLLEEKELNVKQVALDLHKSARTIYQAIQFVRIYPDVEQLPEGKNISWRKLVNHYLPEPKQPCKCLEVENINLTKCKKCGKTLRK